VKGEETSDHLSRIEPADGSTAFGEPAKLPLGARLAVIVALALACWAVPILVLYLRW
jgi:hypothetical protein